MQGMSGKQNGGYQQSSSPQLTGGAAANERNLARYSPAFSEEGPERKPLFNRLGQTAGFSFRIGEIGRLVTPSTLSRLTTWPSSANVSTWKLESNRFCSWQKYTAALVTKHATVDPSGNAPKKSNSSSLTLEDLIDLEIPPNTQEGQAADLQADPPSCPA